VCLVHLASLCTSGRLGCCQTGFHTPCVALLTYQQHRMALSARASCCPLGPFRWHCGRPEMAAANHYPNPAFVLRSFHHQSANAHNPALASSSMHCNSIPSRLAVGWRMYPGRQSDPCIPFAWRWQLTFIPGVGSRAVPVCWRHLFLSWLACWHHSCLSGLKLRRQVRRAGAIAACCSSTAQSVVSALRLCSSRAERSSMLCACIIV
jgi:hypothetical protein